MLLFVQRKVVKLFGFRKFYELRVPNQFMKIMKVLDKKVGETTYIKYRINLPKKVVEDSGLKDKEIIVKGERGRIIIEKE